MSDNLIIAVPKGRILQELEPLMARAGLVPEAGFFDENDRRLQFEVEASPSSQPSPAGRGGKVSLIRVRSFDVATFVAFGAAHLGVAGSDVLAEFNYSEIYAPLDLGIGKCHLSVAEAAELADTDDPGQWSHVRIATKYPEVTRRHFAARGVQAECIKLSGAMELAPKLGLARRIVDLVSSGATLKANGLVEVEKIADVSSRLIVNRAAYKTRGKELQLWVERFRRAVNDA